MIITHAISDLTVLFTCSAGISGSSPPTTTTENLIGSARITKVVLGSPGGAVAPFARRCMIILVHILAKVHFFSKFFHCWLNLAKVCNNNFVTFSQRIYLRNKLSLAKLFIGLKVFLIYMIYVIYTMNYEL